MVSEESGYHTPLEVTIRQVAMFMKSKLLPLVVLAILGFQPAVWCQESVCDLFSHMTTKGDGSQVVLTGDLIASKAVATLGSKECDFEYIADNTVWPIALLLEPATSLPPSQTRDFEGAAVKMDRLRNEGTRFRATARFSGRLKVAPQGWIPAKLVFDSFNNFQIEVLPDPISIPAVSICDLFRDLEAYKGKLIAVRGEFVSTMEGEWIGGRCEGSFITDGYRWPVSLNLGHRPDCSPETTKVCDAKWPAEWPQNDEYMLGGYSDGATRATFVGTLRMRSKYKVTCNGAGWYVGNGFGHLSGAAGELIVEDILNPEATPHRTKNVPIVSEDSERCAPK